jgi:hypothetical protein
MASGPMVFSGDIDVLLACRNSTSLVLDKLCQIYLGQVGHQISDNSFGKHRPSSVLVKLFQFEKYSQLFFQFGVSGSSL